MAVVLVEKDDLVVGVIVDDGIQATFKLGEPRIDRDVWSEACVNEQRVDGDLDGVLGLGVQGRDLASAVNQF